MTTIARRTKAIFEPVEQAVGFPDGSLTLVGLHLKDPNMTFEDWQEIGRKLGHVHRWTAWALGDWLNFGEAQFGELAYDATEGATPDRYDVAQRVTGLAASTLMNYASVCTRVARSRRRVELPFALHEVVASLEPDAQKEWLQAAVDNGWSRSELRAAVKDTPADNGGGSPGGGGGGGMGRLTKTEQVEFAANLVVTTAQPMGDGTFVVPGDALHQLRVALDPNEH